MFGCAESQAVAEPSERQQQDDAGDGDKDIVEPGQQPEMFFIDDRSGPQLRNMVAQGLRRLRRQCTGRYGILQIAFAIHWSCSRMVRM